METFFETLTNLELVQLQNEARLANDQETLNAVLLVLRKREQQLDKTERLRYVSIREITNEFTITIQFEGGGAALKLLRGAPSNEVIAKLRFLAKMLEDEIATRQNSLKACE